MRTYFLYSLITLALVLVFFCFALRSTQVAQGWQPHLLLVSGSLTPPAQLLPSNPSDAAIASDTMSTFGCIHSHLPPRPLDFAWSVDGPRIPAPPVAIIGVFLNEGSNLREWLEHYAEQGFEHFVLLDNGSNDGWQAEIVGFEGAIKVFSCSLKHAQVQMYNTLAVPWLKSQGIEIALVADLDEFAFSTLPGKHLAHLAWGIFNQSESTKISSLLMSWKLFGSSGHVEQPESVREGFTMRKAATGFSGLGKSFVLVSRVNEVGIHVSESATGVRVDEPFSTYLGFQLNHYTIQSKRWFEAVKMTRGDVGTASLDNIRNWDYYARYDFSEHNDTLLQQHAQKWRRDHPECYPLRKKLYHTALAKAAAS